MATGASAIEKIIGWLIPPASREEVLGDLRERCGARMVGEAVRVIPFVIASRIRRTADAVIVVMEALMLFASFVLAAVWLDRGLLFAPSGFACLEIPVAIILITVIFADAYANPKKRSPLRPMLAPFFGLALAVAVPALPKPVMIWGGMVGAILVATLRFLFPPIADRPQAARIPAHWQKLEMETMNLAVGRLLLPFAVAVFVLVAISRWLVK
jgi:hypothetical protein